MGFRQGRAVAAEGGRLRALAEQCAATSAATPIRRVALTRSSGGRVGRPATGTSVASAPRGCSGGAAGAIRHPRQPRRCLMRGRARARVHRCACGNAAYHQRGSHSGYGHSDTGVALHAAESPTPATSTPGGQGSGAAARGRLVRAQRRRSGLRATQGATPPPFPLALHRVGLGW